MSNGLGEKLAKANGSPLHLIITSGLLVTLLTGTVYGSLWVGRLDQRIYDLETTAAQNITLAQAVSITSAQTIQRLTVVEERQNEVLKRLDQMDQHLSSLDTRIDALEIATAVNNQGSTIRRPRL